MATLTASKITESGLTSSPATAAQGGDQFKNTGVEFIRVSNYHRTKTYTVKVEVQNASVVHPQYGATTKGHVYKTIAPPGSGASANVGEVTAYFGPFKPKAFNDANGMVKIYYKDGSVASDSGFSGGSAIPSSNALLEVDVIYLDN
tara:strand:+ start:199 stop:636 length:438 start_codon:yes stop_codon:yes gene_type:complete